LYDGRFGGVERLKIMIRFIIGCIFLGMFLILSYLVFPIEWLIGKINKKAKDYSSLRIVQWGFGVILWIAGTKVTVIGKENMPDEAALYVGNHRSFFDILIMYVQCKDLTGFVAKDSLGKIPSLRVWMRYVYCLFLDRKDIKQGMMTILQAIEYVKQGVSIGIFPEGTYHKKDLLLPFKPGVISFAEKTGAPIIPFVIDSTFKFRCRPIIIFGEPIYVDKIEVDNKVLYLENIIATMLIESKEKRKQKNSLKK
jgi:1-acyl-sn-glycerol-3-phosphate acyltransferase